MGLETNTPMLSGLLPSARSSQHGSRLMPTPSNHLLMPAAFATAPMPACRVIAPPNTSRCYQSLLSLHDGRDSQLAAKQVGPPLRRHRRLKSSARDFGPSAVQQPEKSARTRGRRLGTRCGEARSIVRERNVNAPSMHACTHEVVQQR